MPIAGLLLLAIVALLAGCAGPRLDVAPMPQRDADLYPWAERQAGIVVAVDEILEPARVKQYFGADLLAQGILPVSVIVSNRGDGRITVGPADVLLVQGREVIDPLPITQVVNVVEREGGIDGGADVEDHFARLALRQTALAPNESYQGVLFFPYARPERARDRDRERKGDLFSTIFRLFEGGLQMNVGVTDAETGERLHFGPFRLGAGAEGWRDVLDLERWRERGRSMDGEREGRLDAQPLSSEGPSYRY